MAHYAQIEQSGYAMLLCSKNHTIMLPSPGYMINACTRTLCYDPFLATRSTSSLLCLHGTTYSGCSYIMNYIKWVQQGVSEASPPACNTVHIHTQMQKYNMRRPISCLVLSLVRHSTIVNYYDCG